MKLNLLNYVAFQIGWLACVMSAANGRPLLGLAAASAMIALHLKLAANRWTEIKLLLVCTIIGTVFDSLLLATGWVSYPNGEWIPGLAPFWIVAMWLLFAATLNLSMAWLKGRLLLAVLMGAAGGPLSYIAGQKLHAIRLENSEAALITLAVGWAFMMPALSALAQRWNGFEQIAPITVVDTRWSRERVNGHV